MISSFRPDAPNVRMDGQDLIDPVQRPGYVIAVNLLLRPNDCHPLLEILAFELPMIGKPAIAVLLEQARKKTMRVWAEQ